MKSLWPVAAAVAAYLLLPLLQQEAWGWCPILAKQLVRWAAWFMPFDLRQRYRQEWLTEIEAFEGRNLSMVVMAARILLFAPKTGLAHLLVRWVLAHREPLVLGRHERSQSASENRR